jgi:hypothetical protein
VYTCQIPATATFEFTRCEYRVGVVRGSVEFAATLADGATQVTQVTQAMTRFALPIQRRTLTIRAR